MSNDILTKEEALLRIDDLPRLVFSRLKGKLLSDIEEIVGEKLVDEQGNDVMQNGRFVYKPTTLLQSLKTVVSTRLQILSADLKTELDQIKKHV